ncbi:hypothetical protein TNCV_4380651 [Trichonephila clavipes]|nr:hypothetical protein TNCV_4380651 [Trichonephila clavipes]
MLTTKNVSVSSTVLEDQIERPAVLRTLRYDKRPVSLTLRYSHITDLQSGNELACSTSNRTNSVTMSGAQNGQSGQVTIIVSSLNSAT